MVAATLLGLLAPWPLALLVDGALGSGRAPGWLEPIASTRGQLVVVAAVLGLLLTITANLVQVADEYVKTSLAQRMTLDFRSELFAHAQRLSQSFHDANHTGVFIARINLEARNLGDVATAIPPLAQSALTLVGMFAIAVTMSPLLAAVAIGVVPFVYVSTGFYARNIDPRLYEVRNAEGRSLSIVHEAMSMLRVIVAFGREGYELGRFRRQAQRTVDARIDVTVRQTLFSLVVDGITATGYALVLGLGAQRVLRGDLTVGQLLVIVAYIQAVYQPLQHISGTIASLQNLFVGLEGAFDLLDTAPEVTNRPDARAMTRAAGRLHFDNVSYTYPGRHATLRDISLELAPGERLAIVGPTGAGKTTLANLLIRYADPDAGRILLDGHDLRDLTLASLREQFAFVHQDPLLFSGSILDNIRYGRLTASDDEVRAAARAAEVHDAIVALPQGYHTRLSERGGRLSGGERQRIAIARAFVKDAPLLVLDEPTSALDARTEAALLATLDRLMQGRTTLVIAHRLSTIRDADRIAVVRDGAIVELGAHTDLLQRDGEYAALWRFQHRDEGASRIVIPRGGC